MMCGSSSNEHALKTAFMWYQAQKRGGPPTTKYLESSMRHESPGTPNVTVLSFEGAFHGRTLGSVTDFTYTFYISELEDIRVSKTDRCYEYCCLLYVRILITIFSYFIERIVLSTRKSLQKTLLKLSQIERKAESLFAYRSNEIIVQIIFIFVYPSYY